MQENLCIVNVKVSGISLEEVAVAVNPSFCFKRLIDAQWGAVRSLRKTQTLSQNDWMIHNDVCYIRSIIQPYLKILCRLVVWCIFGRHMGYLYFQKHFLGTHFIQPRPLWKISPPWLGFEPWPPEQWTYELPLRCHGYLAEVVMPKGIYLKDLHTASDLIGLKACC